MYDEHLRPAGLTIGQYSLLAALYYVPSISVRKLAARLELDRTTLTRNLKLLERDGMLSIAVDPEDTRVRSVSITELGLAKLAESYPLWSSAQEQLARVLGAAQLHDFRHALDGSISSMKAQS